MCGRFILRTPVEALAQQFHFDAGQAELELRYNIAPSQPVAVIPNGERRELKLFRWGLIPFWAKDAKTGRSLINARAEDAAKRPAYRHAFRTHRCLVLADGFYEWQGQVGGKKRTPFYLGLKGGRPFAFAGLWETWHPPGGGEPVRSCALLTTQANATVAAIHDRMPVILRPEDYERWLSPGEVAPEELQPLLRPYPAEEMESHPVSTAVNSPDNEGPQLLEPGA